jgi:signal transduction histidine kinase/GAF domain-containing protein
LLVPFAETGLVVSGVQIKPFGYAPTIGPAMYFWMLFVYAVLIIALLNFVRSWKTSDNAEQRNRAAYIVVAMCFALVGGVFDILPLLGFPLYPGVIIGNIAFCLLVTVAILRYKLLDIHIVLRKSVAYILTSALIALPFVGVFLLVSHFFKEVRSSPWVYFLLLVALALILPQLWQWIQQRVERWFYRERYDYLKALGTFSWETQSVIDSAKLGSTMVNLLTGALRTSSVHLLQPLPPGGDFTVAFSSNLYHSSSHIILKRESPLVKWLERSKGMLYYEDIDIIPQLQGISSKERETLQQLRTKFIIGLKTPTGRLSGLLILGPKLSEQPYTIEDMQLIYAISSQAAIKLENARLYSDALRARENLEMWLNSMSDCVMIVNTDYTIRFMNKAAVENFGDRADETCWNALRKDNDCLGCPIQQYLCGNREAFHFPNDIGGRHYEAAVAPLLNPDGGLSVVEVLRDVTERKLAEEREKQLQEELNLAGRLAAIGELAAGVAHEINNPLTAILAFSERLLRRSTDEKTTEDLKIVYNEARRTAKVVENLLTFARHREPKKQYADINDIVQKALELRAYEFKTANIEAITELTPNLPQVVVDFQQIQEVFLNIILNAEQAMTSAKGGGKLSIKTQQMKGYIRISFTDNGSGIPAEYLDKVFNPFFTTRGKIGGTGLGLSICHGIVTEHGGKIYVKSKPGKGATFFVDLPLAREEKDGSKAVHKGRAYLQE